ncbi:MAG: FAD-dependent oxidoreductase [Anaerolineae bacterium]|nr:FAD-dependent oxidoreductase [Anaerolineae bacterium]MDW8067688.1 FAD-dependent oxidoreductase [Anaerolineae bacterium]
MSFLGTPVYDLLIIGGGPAGATAALYGARAGLKTLVIDKGLTAGAAGKAGQIVNFPGLGPISGPDLVRRIRKQAASFGAEFVTDKVLRVDLSTDPRQVWAGQGVYQGRALIIATGSMGRSRYLPGEERLVGRGVSYCATCDAAFFRDREVAVLGNNDEAVEEALTLARFAARVHFLSPTAELHASPELAQGLSDHPKVAIRLSTQVEEILGNERVEGVRIVSPEGKEVLPVAGVFVYLQGNVPVTDFLEGQLPLGEGGCLRVDEHFQTAVPGVFAVGDVLCRHLKQAVVAAAEGAVAAMAADRYLHGRAQLRPDWSRS